MSDGNTEGPQDDPAFPIARTESAPANFETEIEGERSRSQETAKAQEKIREDAISLAAQRDIADLVNRNDAYIRQALETAKLNAKIRDNGRGIPPPTRDEGSVLRENLVSERKSASSVTFGLVIASILVIIGLIAGGVYYFSSQNNGNNAAAGGVAPGVVAEATVPANSADASDPAKTPMTISIDRAPPAEGAPVTDEKDEKLDPVAAPISGALGGGGANDLARENVPMNATGQSGSGLPSDAKLTTDRSNAPSEGVLVLPSSETENGKEQRTTNP